MRQMEKKNSSFTSVKPIAYCCKLSFILFFKETLVRLSLYSINKKNTTDFEEFLGDCEEK